MSERLQKILARAGVSSRRAAEELITSGRVLVNGKPVTELGSRADLDRDRIEVDGRPIAREEHVYYLLHKPRGIVTTLSDPEGRPNLSELLERIEERVYPVGRLDFHTSGALLLTNDGDLAQGLLHPSRAVPKTYVAKVSREVDKTMLRILESGVTLDDGYKTQPAIVEHLRDEEGKSWLEITITEGKNRQIHRMLEALDTRVMRLSRVSFAGLSTEDLRPGAIRPLSRDEVAMLKRQYLGVDTPEEPKARAGRAAPHGKQPEGDRRRKDERAPSRAAERGYERASREGARAGDSRPARDRGRQSAQPRDELRRRADTRRGESDRQRSDSRRRDDVRERGDVRRGEGDRQRSDSRRRDDVRERGDKRQRPALDLRESPRPRDRAPATKRTSAAGLGERIRERYDQRDQQVANARTRQTGERSSRREAPRTSGKSAQARFQKPADGKLKPARHSASSDARANSRDAQKDERKRRHRS